MNISYPNFTRRIDRSIRHSTTIHQERSTTAENATLGRKEQRAGTIQFHVDTVLLVLVIGEARSRTIVTSDMNKKIY